MPADRSCDASRQGLHEAQRRSGPIRDMVMISERPAEVADRAVPGHWEGDLIFGKKMTSIGTLVERHSRYVILLELPERHAPPASARDDQTDLDLPAQLRRSITWDQGKEMAEHVQFTIDTGVQIYFCDPKSPWQRGSNENTNGLLRQYLPKTTDLSQCTQRELDAIARSAQHTTSTDPRMDDTITSVRQRRCDDRLNPQADVSASRDGAARRRPAGSRPVHERLQRAGLEAAHLLRPAAPLGHPPRPGERTRRRARPRWSARRATPWSPQGTVGEDQLPARGVRACRLLELLDQSAGVDQDALVLHVERPGRVRRGSRTTPRGGRRPTAG